MKKIFKYVLKSGDSVQVVNMPINFEILHFDTQNKLPCIWAAVDTSVLETGATVNVEFHTVCTGEAYESDRLKYIGTYQQWRFVGHVFQKI